MCGAILPTHTDIIELCQGLRKLTLLLAGRVFHILILFKMRELATFAQLSIAEGGARVLHSLDRCLLTLLRVKFNVYKKHDP